MFAADKQLDDILAEGLENRYARHEKMADMTRNWARRCGFEMFSEEGTHSPTVSTIANTRNVDIAALNKHLKSRGMMISNGYGKLKDKTMRIAHMGDCQPEHLEALFAAMDEFLAKEG
jgi:aspartate aminotransferase-like enzyme